MGYLPKRARRKTRRYGFLTGLASALHRNKIADDIIILNGENNPFWILALEAANLNPSLRELGVLITESTSLQRRYYKEPVALHRLGIDVEFADAVLGFAEIISETIRRMMERARPKLWQHRLGDGGGRRRGCLISVD